MNLVFAHPPRSWLNLLTFISLGMIVLGCSLRPSPVDPNAEMRRYIDRSALGAQAATAGAAQQPLAQHQLSAPTDRSHAPRLPARNRDISEVIRAAYPEPLADEPGLDAPLSIEADSFTYQDITPDEAIRSALANSRVFRDLGGAILQSPQQIRTIYEPASVESDPRFGVESVLSAFDAQLRTSALLEKNNRAINNRFLSGQGNILEQDLFNFDWELSKRSATGAEFTARHRLDYDASNVTGNLFPHAWTTIIEGEVRQPLLRGAGWQFNRIAGPLSAPGVINGVVVARLNADISLLEFEEGMRDLVSSVENAYWDLYYAYRDLQAKKRARDSSLRILQEIRAQGGLRAAQIRALATEQYYRFQADVEDALGGRLVEGTQPDNGSSGGTFRGVPGVLVAERRLRLLMGVPINDGALLRPAVEPTQARVVFDWREIANEALQRRSELNRQRLVVERTQMELVASKNFLLPQFDAVGLYRWRGFGENLLDAKRAGRSQFDNAYGDLTSGDFQEWQLGVELSFPLGFRRAHAGVRNAQLRLAREQAVLWEQERQVIHDLSNVVTDMERSYRVARTAFNRYQAAVANRKAVEDRERLNAKADLAAVLDAQRRELDAETQYFRKLVEYVVSIKNVHYEKGTLLQFNDVILAEDIDPGQLAPPPAAPVEDATPSLAPPQPDAPRLDPELH